MGVYDICTACVPTMIMTQLFFISFPINPCSGDFIFTKCLGVSLHSPVCLAVSLRSDNEMCADEFVHSSKSQCVSSMFLLLCCGSFGGHIFTWRRHI